MRKFFPLLSFLLFFCVSHNTSFAQNYGAKSIFKKYNDAVVVIYACDSYGKPVAQGSGVVLNSQGLIVTNYHVCQSYTNIKIKHEDLIVEDVTILGGSKDDDLMFLKVAPDIFGFIPAGNSDKLEVGQKVYALGSPLGFENSITEGIVNGIRKDSDNESYIQLSASITHGSSGGALITAGGKLIGITFGGMEEGQNINFAIPINKVLSSGIFAANKFDEPETEKSEKKKTKKKKSEDITSTDTEKKVKKPRKKKKDTEITSGTDSGSIAKIPGRTTVGKSTTANVSSEEYLEKGNSAYKLKDFSTALSYFSKCIEADPSNLKAYYCRGLTYLELKKYDASISDFNYVVRELPSETFGYMGRGFAYMRMERYNDAISDFAKSFELDKTNIYSVFGLGECYYNTEEYAKSALCFTTYMLYDSKNAASYYYRGRCIVEGNLDSEYLDACKDFQKAYSLGLDEAKEYVQQYCR